MQNLVAGFAQRHHQHDKRKRGDAEEEQESKHRGHHVDPLFSGANVTAQPSFHIETKKIDVMTSCTGHMFPVRSLVNAP